MDKVIEVISQGKNEVIVTFENKEFKVFDIISKDNLNGIEFDITKIEDIYYYLIPILSSDINIIFDIKEGDTFIKVAQLIGEFDTKIN